MPKVLLIEDDSQTAELIQMVLAPRGFDFVHTSDGAAAVDLAKNNPPDLILLDVMLPGLDGYGVQSQLLEQEETRSIPVIMMTSKSEMKGAFELATNVAGFIAKPFIIREFVDLVKSVLEKK